MSWLEKSWYRHRTWQWLLLPLHWLLSLLVIARRQAYRLGVLKSSQPDCPVIVVGNISVGGTGKTPFTEWLVRRCQEAGYRPGVVSRGYGGQATSWPRRVDTADDPQQVGDEPLMLARKLSCPVVIDPVRSRGARYLCRLGCDLLICDDGLQHYALGRDLEICIVDGQRGLGTGLLMPLGPLREPRSRLGSVDFVISNGAGRIRHDAVMSLTPVSLVNVRQPAKSIPLDSLAGQEVTAVAGIGNPARFFSSLESTGVKARHRAYPDHYQFSAEDFTDVEGPVIMTEKDAVKCQEFARDDFWYLAVAPQLEPDPGPRILKCLEVRR